jgi:chemotaxis protein MotB
LPVRQGTGKIGTMPKYTWLIASILTATLLAGLMGFSLYTTRQELAQVRKQGEETRSAAAKAATEAARLKEELAESQSQAEAMRKEKEATVQSHKSLEDEMRAALESKDVTISQLQGKLTVNILDRVLYDSGEAVLKPDGEAVLQKVAAILAQYPNLKIHVIGHTDNVPIRGGLRGRFPSNWELSTGRATAAVRFLTEKAGVDPSRMGAVGYGEFRPVADNSTADGRAKNRRIAITILSEELVGADTVPLVAAANTALPAAPALVTNGVPEAVEPAPVHAEHLPEAK